MINYHFPPLDKLYYADKSKRVWKQELAQELGEELTAMFASFNMDVRVVDCSYNPYAVLLRLKLGTGIKIDAVKALRTDIELHMRGPVEFLVKEGRFVVAVKLMERPIVPLREVIESREFTDSLYTMPIAAGVDLLGSIFVFDLAVTPNILVAGVTGSGKSVFLSDIILSILYHSTPDEVKFLMIDMKGVELTAFAGIPHMLLPPITNTDTGLDALKWLANEAKERNDRMLKIKAKNVDEYNRSRPDDKRPRIVVIVDEFMEFVFRASEDFNGLLKQIARNSGRTGIHLILATQRPSEEVISAEIKRQIPCRAAFVVVDKRESEIIMDRTGAERLLGAGDMIFTRRENDDAIHAQAAYVSFEEIDGVIDFLRHETAFFGEEPIIKE